MLPLSTYGATTTESFVKMGGTSFSTSTGMSAGARRRARATPTRKQSSVMR